ncbi:hypothetical protein ACLB2K_055078 [Fragaria x ananassa]
MNIDLDEIDDGGLRFSEENYYHQLSSDGEDSENENVVEDLDDVGDDETNRGGKGDCENEEKGVESKEYGDELTNEVTNGGIGGGFDSEWLSLLQGKNMKMLRLEDVKDIGFTSVQQAEQFYSYYSYIVGFSTKRYKIEKRHVKGTEVIFRRAWACSKEGHCKTLKNKKQVPFVLKVGEDGNEKAGTEKSKGKKKDVAREIKYTRTGCLAVMYVKRDKDTGKYHVSKFATEHNHGLACISERHFLRSHRHVSVQDIAEVLALQEAQVSTSVAYDYLVNQAGGQEFVGFMLKDLYNKMDANRKLNTEVGDAQAAMNWLKIKGKEDPQFFCRYTKDADGRLANLFWRDHGSLMDYEAYGDVLIIDSTYKTNIYGMPLVLFVGANNHRGSVVFACALVSNEKEDTFTWVIEKFLASMKNNPPKSVVTDGDEAMRKVLSNLMPGARPRLCAWHIGRNVCQNVKNEEVQKKVGKMIYASHTIGEWEEAWQSLIVEYGLENNTWMSSLYAKRERWAEAFCKGHFYGGMCSTQCCEGMNSKLKKRVGKFTRLLDFISRIYRCIDRLRDRAASDKFKSKNHLRKFDTHMKALEEEAFNTFTDDIFLVIKGQIRMESMFFVSNHVIFGDGKNMMFYVSQYDQPRRSWTVGYTSESSGLEDVYECNCKLFESDGVPCCHIFCVMKCARVMKFPKSLECERWTKCSKVNICGNKACGNVTDNASQVIRYKALIAEAKRSCHNMSQSVEGFDWGMAQLHTVTEASMKYRLVKKARLNLEETDNVVRDPVIVRTKGMHGNKESTDNGKAADPPRCGKCRLPGHNARRCPLKNSNLDGKGTSGIFGSKSVDNLSDRCNVLHKTQPSVGVVELNEENLESAAPSAIPSYMQPPFEVGNEMNENVDIPDLNSQVGR